MVLCWSQVFLIFLIVLISSKPGLSQCDSLSTNELVNMTENWTFTVSSSSNCSVIRTESGQRNFSITLPSVHSLTNSSTYNGQIICQVCSGTEILDLSRFDRSSCDVEFDSQTNELIFQNCDSEVVTMENCQIMVANCSDVYVIETIDCDAYCAVNKSEGSMFKSEDFTWRVCPTVDLNQVSAVPNMECRRKECISFFEEACSSCAMRCPEHIYYSDNASALCPSHLVSNSQGMCQDSCKSLCLDCERRDRTYCHRICEDPSQNNFAAVAGINLCKDDTEVLEIETFCANRISKNCSSFINTLSEINCTRSQEKCDSICRQEGLVGFYGRGCPSEVFHFCDEYTRNLNTKSDLDLLADDSFIKFVEIINAFLNNVSPSLLVSSIRKFLLKVNNSVLLEDSNTELLLNVFDRLLDDCISSNWLNDSVQDSGAGSTVLFQLETLAELISTSIIESGRNNSFSYQGNNVDLAITPVSETIVVNGQYQLNITGENNLGELAADVTIPQSVLCDKYNNCSSILSVALINNLAEYLNEASQEILSDKFDTLGTILPVSQLLSIQVFGIDNLAEKLSDNPVQITLKLNGTIADVQIGCFFWNWTIMLQIFQKVHMFVHLNLALTLFLGYIYFVFNTYGLVKLNRGACAFVTVFTHYFLLSAFSWMLCEGIMLYLMLVVVFSKLAKRWWFFSIIGYGLPVIPVIVTLSVRSSDYGIKSCWLSDDAKYGFIGPAMGILLVNIIFLIIALGKVLQVNYKKFKRTKMANPKGNQRNLKAIRKLFRKLFVATTVLAPLLGITWLSGITLAFIPSSISAWIYSISNIIQGVLFFYLLVVRSDAVWETPRAKAIKAFFSKCLPKKRDRNIDIISRTNTISVAANRSLYFANHRSILKSNHPKLSEQDGIEGQQPVFASCNSQFSMDDMEKENSAHIVVVEMSISVK